MPHPFFESASYPWQLPEAEGLHRALSQAITQPGRIELLYRASGSELPPLPLQGAADQIWKDALEALTTASRLREFCDRILRDQALASIHGTVRAVIGAGEPHTRTPAVRSRTTDTAEPQKPVVTDTKPGEAGTDPGVGPPGAWTVLMSSIRAVPEMKYALAVAGLAAAAVIVRQFFSTPTEAAVGVFGIFLMMILVVVFTVAVGVRGELQGIALLLIRAVVILTIVVLVLVISSVFFKWPMGFPELIAQVWPVDHSLPVTVVSSDGKPVRGARIAAKGRTYNTTRTADDQGVAVFDAISSAESNLEFTASASGFQDGRIRASTTQANPPRIVLALIAPQVTAPPIVPSKPPTDGTTKQPSLTDELRGTWEIVVAGDVANIHVRRGTFEFRPQPDGEVLVNASFDADGMDSRLTGRGSIGGSRLFVTFDVKTTEGGSWSGRATFERTARNRLSGRIPLKSGNEAPVQLRKLGQ